MLAQLSTLVNSPVVLLVGESHTSVFTAFHYLMSSFSICRLLKKQFFHRALKVMKKKTEKDTKKEKEKEKPKSDSSKEEEKKGKKEKEKKKEPEAVETKKEKSVCDPLNTK